MILICEIVSFVFVYIRLIFPSRRYPGSANSYISYTDSVDDSHNLHKSRHSSYETADIWPARLIGHRSGNVFNGSIKYDLLSATTHTIGGETGSVGDKRCDRKLADNFDFPSAGGN